MKATEELDVAAERVMVEEALKDEAKLAVLEEMGVLRRAGTVAVANVEDAVLLWSKNVHVTNLVMEPGSDPEEAEAVRNYCRSNNWNAMGNVV
ncbi:hypothetical protein RHGRI_032186 [Rhododendron griersonianum]|uniref:Uncharacterized protein n=1 Tax=Rhododendron griersonianum TaxID=479676 RepID=A0AAV6IGP5_9ERIC|nr:hypothetical protein RHGRI_032186 [Rhododendron griersonianum]